jgi:bacterioferritin-associated ferredoxin
MNRFAAILAFVAIFLSGGGVSKFAHVMVAHGGCTEIGSSCNTHRPLANDFASAAKHACASAMHAVEQDTAEQDTAEHHLHDPLADDCAVCVELAASLLAPTLFSPFTTVLSVLALVHDREAAQIPAPSALAACAARPPPHAA